VLLTQDHSIEPDSRREPTVSKRVLIAIDGSDIALAALDQAVEVAGTDAAFIALTVTDPVDRVASLGAAAFDPEITRSALERVREDAHEHLDAAETQLKSRGVTSIERVTLHGRAGEAIVSLARARDIDLVVLGTHGRSGFARTLMGSVAEYVVRHLHGVPVLLFHPEAAEG